MNETPNSATVTFELSIFNNRTLKDFQCSLRNIGVDFKHQSYKKGFKEIHTVDIFYLRRRAYTVQTLVNSLAKMIR